MVEKNYDCSVSELSELVGNDEVNSDLVKPKVLGVFYLKDSKDSYASCPAEDNCETDCGDTCSHHCPCFDQSSV